MGPKKKQKTKKTPHFGGTVGISGAYIIYNARIFNCGYEQCPGLNGELPSQKF